MVLRGRYFGDQNIFKRKYNQIPAMEEESCYLLVTYVRQQDSLQGFNKENCDTR